MQRLDPRSYASEEAVEVLGLLARAERAAAAGKALMARKVQRSGAWEGKGEPSAAHFVARATKEAVGTVVETLDTARRLERLPQTEMAFRSGELSPQGAREVAAAAEVSPEHEQELLGVARTGTPQALRERCLQVKAAATEELERYRRIHRERSLRHWTDQEGAVRLEARLPPDAGATVVAAVTAGARALADQARAEGRTEPARAHAADALVAAVASGGSGGSGGPRAVIHVRVDHAAFTRGHAQGEETCEIAGIGPVPVATVRAMASDAVLKAVVTRGTDVVAVAHPGRTIPAAVRTALQERDRTCAVPGCPRRDGLEIDHVDRFSQGGPTTLANLVRLCRPHHALKTYFGYTLGGKPGARTWTGPDPPKG